MAHVWSCTVLAVLGACTKGTEPGPQVAVEAARPAVTTVDAAPPAQPAQPAHVAPEAFACASLVSADELAGLLGGTATPIESSMPVPRGVPRPCGYQVGEEAWIFDLDCRENYQKTADALFAQYAQLGGVVVAVGAKAIDFSGQALMFVDDDAPCYVRVVGRDATRRLELAKHLAKRLMRANAPTP